MFPPMTPATEHTRVRLEDQQLERMAAIRARTGRPVRLALPDLRGLLSRLRLRPRLGNKPVYR
jgi:hypothetical protein